MFDSEVKLVALYQIGTSVEINCAQLIKQPNQISTNASLIRENIGLIEQKFRKRDSAATLLRVKFNRESLFDSGQD